MIDLCIKRRGVTLDHLTRELDEQEQEHGHAEAREKPADLLPLQLAPSRPTADCDTHGFGMRSVALTMALPLAR